MMNKYLIKLAAFEAAFLLALMPPLASAQTYPGPTFNSLILQNPLTPANGGTGATTSTGTGSVALSNSPAFTTPNLGTPSAVTLTHGTGLPVSTGLSGLGTGVGTALGNAVTGSGSPVLATSPSIASPTITGAFTATGLVTTADLATAAANTVLANVTASSASPSAFAMPSCSGANNALRWTSGTGFTCASAIALTSSGLNQFASTTSAQLASIISDETGSGSLVFGNSPTFTGTPTIPFTQTGTGAIARTLDARNRDYINAADFGVVCDGVTNNTTAFNNAVAAAEAVGRPLYIFSNGGTCMTDEINYGTPQPAISIYGDGAVLQKISNDGNPVMVIGSLTTTHYIGPFVISGITFSGYSSTTTPAAVLGYDVVRASFVNDVFQNAQVGLLQWGEISTDYYNDVFQNNEIGYRGDTNTSLYGGGVPNLITMVGSKFIDNTTYGIFYNGGNELFVKGFDIEGNGTTGTSASGGAYISAATTGIGAVFDSGWFEANAGGQNLWLNGGINRVESAHFIASPNATVDIKVTAGNYTLDSVVCVAPKSPNLSESGTNAGNMIINTACANLAYTPANTAALEGTGLNALGSITASSTITPNTVAGIVGTALGDAAQAGSIGQVLVSNIPFGSAISLTSGTAAAITSLPLTAGDWDVQGQICTAPAGTTVQQYVQGGIGLTSASLTSTGDVFVLPFTAIAGDAVCAGLAPFQENVTTSTTMYLNVTSTFTTSTNKAYGYIFARRRR